jgi:beta-galactosidase GanA
LGGLIILLTLLCGATQFISPTYASTLEPKRRLDFLRTDGTQIVDGMGRTILLRGANFRGYDGGDPRQWQTSHSETDYQNMKSWGFNVVRLPISWGEIEKTPGVYDQNYFAYVDRDIAWAKKYGIYVILDMHQWNWNEKWGGNGAPSWTVTQYPSTKKGRLSAVEDFWTNQTLRESLLNTWKLVASRYSNDTTVIGYDLLNEPWQLFDGSKHTQDARWSIIETLYIDLIDAVRSVDAKHIVFVEPYLPFLSTFRPIQRPNLVWTPHFYAYAECYFTYVESWQGYDEVDSYGKPYYHDNATLLENYLELFYSRVVKDFQQPIWIGEFGMEMSVQGSDIWTQDCIQLFQKYGLGWAWWSYWRSNDPSFYLLDGQGVPKEYFLQFLRFPQLTLPQ